MASHTVVSSSLCGCGVIKVQMVMWQRVAYLNPPLHHKEREDANGADEKGLLDGLQ